MQIWDAYLPLVQARELQECISNLPADKWDQYHNMLESKYTLRNKFSLPPLLEDFFATLNTPEALEQWRTWALEKTGCNYIILSDPHRHYYGVHKFVAGDHLDIHVDAGLHPLSQGTLRKYITFGLYLTSEEYTADMGGQLEFWTGTSAALVNPMATVKTHSIDPLFNRAVAFINTDQSWHGAPCVYTGSNPRIFLTLSYLITKIDAYPHLNTRALFVPCAGEELDQEKDEVRRKRVHEQTCTSAYRCS